MTLLWAGTDVIKKYEISIKIWRMARREIERACTEKGEVDVKWIMLNKIFKNSNLFKKNNLTIFFKYIYIYFW